MVGSREGGGSSVRTLPLPWPHDRAYDKVTLCVMLSMPQGQKLDVSAGSTGEVSAPPAPLVLQVRPSPTGRTSCAGMPSCPQQTPRGKQQLGSEQGSGSHFFGPPAVFELTSVEHHPSCSDKEPPSGGRRPALESWLQHLLQTELWARVLTF